MTFGEYVTECELYPYSREHYELMKECMELTLMEQTMENHEFMEVRGKEINADHPLTEGYFQEEMDSYYYDTLAEAAEEKAEGIGAKIHKAFITVLERVKKFFSTVAKKLSTLGQKAQKVVETAINNKPFSEQDVTELENKLGSIFEGDEKPVGPFSEKDNLLNGRYTNLKLEGGGSLNTSHRILQNILAIFIPQQEGKLKVPRRATAVPKACSADGLADVLDNVITSKKGAAAALQEIEGSRGSGKDILLINTKSDELQKVVDSLDALTEELKKSVENKKEARQYKKRGNKASNEVEAEFTYNIYGGRHITKEYMAPADVLAAINAAVADTIKFYSDIITSKNTVLSEVANFIRSK